MYFDKDSLFILNETSEEKEYTNERTNNVHLGQLKLLLSEMQTLIYYADPSEANTVVYIGAAHGFHIYVMAKLFPDFNFHLYDRSGGWDQRLYKLENVHVNNHYFMDEDIAEWREKREGGTGLILFSDIRNLSITQTDVEKNNEVVEKDMDLQRKWVEELKPKIALLKFRLPYVEECNKKKYPKGTYKYLDGEIYRQIFSPKHSAETRLLVRGIGYREWDFGKYERQNFHHNTVIRQKIKYINPIRGDETPILKQRGLLNGYDETAMTIIVMDYLKKTNTAVKEEYVMKMLYFILNNCYASKNINLYIERKLT